MANLETAAHRSLQKKLDFARQTGKENGYYGRTDVPPKHFDSDQKAAYEEAWLEGACKRDRFNASRG